MTTGTLPFRSWEPANGCAAFQLAQLYAAGIIPAADVVQMRAERWRQLGGHEMETDDPSVCSLRAVICVLYTPQEDQQDDLVDLSFFLGFGQQNRATLNAAGAPSARVLRTRWQ